MSETETPHTQRGRTETEFAQPGVPVLAGPEGILYDVNYGCHVQVPVDGWHVRMSDLDTFNVVLDETVEANAVITSRRKYFVRFLLEVFDSQRLVFSHALDATNRKVRLRMQPLALGDSLAWMPVIDAFREQHQCKLHMPLAKHLQPRYRDGYPHLHDARRRRGLHRQPAIAGTHEPVASRGFFYRIRKWAVAARMGRRHARGHDQRLLASVDRVPHAVSCD